jgi:hypothetical protein
MATFTSAATGDWNASATWGNSGSPAVEGTDYPGNGDIAVIANTHVVTITGTVPSSGYLAHIHVQNGGTLKHKTDANTKVSYSGNTAGETAFVIDNGGTYNCGTVADPIGSGYTAEIHAYTSGDNRLVAGSTATVTLQGYPKFGATPTNFRCTTTDAIASVSDKTVATSIDVAAAGWAAGDEIVISTTGSAGQTENKTIESVSGSTLTIDENWSNTHLAGAEIVNATRNVKVVTDGGSFSLHGFNGANIDCDYVYFSIGWGGSGPWYDGAKYLDNSVLWDCGGDFVLKTVAGSTYINLLFYLCAYLSTQVNQRNVTFSNCSWAKSDYEHVRLDTNCSPVKFTGCNFYDSQSSNGGAWSGSVYNDYGSHSSVYYTDAGYAEFINCKFWRNVDYAWHLGGWIVKAVECTLGGDGTNTVANGASDLVLNYSGQTTLHNCKLLSSTEVARATYSNAGAEHTKTFIASKNHDQTTGRFKSWFFYGEIGDQITVGGLAASDANGGSGTSIYFDPSSTTAGNTLDWEFFIPVTASTAFVLKFYVKTLQTTNGPTLTCTIYDSDDDNTKLLDASSVTLTGSWAQVSMSSCTPTDTGFCRVVLSALKGSGSETQALMVDDVSVT